MPRRGQLADQPVNLRLAAHVHAARRLVEQQHVGLLVQQPAQGHLLLVAAAQLADRLLGPRQRTAAASASRRTACRRRQSSSQPNAAVGPQPAVGQVVGDALVERQPLALAVLAEQADALRDARGAA